MRIGTKSRGCAWLAADLHRPGCRRFSLFMPRFRGDAWLLHPQRLGVLVKYGEGPYYERANALIPIRVRLHLAGAGEAAPMGDCRRRHLLRRRRLQ